MKYSSFVKFPFAILAFISFFSVHSQSIIKGKVSGEPKPKRIFVFEMYGSIPFKLDSFVVKPSGEFLIKRKDGFPRGFYKIGFSEENSSVLVLGNESFEMELDAKNAQLSSFKGSQENEIYNAYKAYNNFVNQSVQILSNKYRMAASLVKKDKEKYETEIQKVKVSFDSLLAAQAVYMADFKDKNKAFFAGKVAGFMMDQTNLPKENFLDFELIKNDPELLRGDMIQNKLGQYFQHYASEDPDQGKKDAEMILAFFEPKSKAKEVVYQSLLLNYIQMDASFANKLYAAASKEFPSKYTQKIGAYIPFSPEIGMKAPDILLNDRNGKVFPLSNLKGKVVLLDFWASWCGPCRHENPTVVAAYNKYKDKGFTVFSVSLDNNRDKWLNAIEKDGLVWENHVSDLKGWASEGAKAYGVQSIPAAFLLDREGKIIAMNLRGPQLEAKLQEVIGK